MIEASRRTGGGFKGTFAYVAPEQIDPKSFGGVDWRTVVYQLGCVLYEMVAERHPYLAQEAPALMYSILNESPAPLSGVSWGLEGIIPRALSKRKEDRFESVDVMVYELRGIV